MIKTLPAKFLITASIILILTGLIHSQEIRWIVEPTITDYPIVKIYPDEKLLVVKNDKDQYGIKNFDNKLIVPVEFNSISIAPISKIIIARQKDGLGTEKSYWNFEGILQSDKKNHSRFWSNSRLVIERRLKRFDKIFKKYENLKFHLISDTVNVKWQQKLAFQVTDLQDNIILDSVSQVRELTPNLIICNKNILDAKGKLLYKLKIRENVSKFKDGVKIWDRTSCGFYDSKFNLIFELPHSLVDFKHDDFLISVDADKNKFLHKSDGAIVFPKSSKDVRFSHKLNCFSFKEEDGMVRKIYYPIEDKFVDLDLPSNYHPKKSYFVTVNKDKLYGLVDIRTGKIVLDPKYKFLRLFNEYIITSPTKYTREGINVLNIFNHDGELVKKSEVTEFRISNDYITLYNSDGTYTVLDSNLKEIKQSQGNEKFKHMGDYALKVVEGDASKIYLFKDIGKSPEIYYKEFVSYQWTSGWHKNEFRTDVRKTPIKIFYFIVDKNGSTRALDGKGQFLSDDVFDYIQPIQTDEINFFSVTKNNKHGVIMVQ